MQRVLFEEPIWIVGTGLIATTIIGYCWLHSGRRWLLYGIGLTVLLTVLLTTVNVQVQTSRERLHATLYEISGALQRNERSIVLSFIHPKAEPTVQRARDELPRYKFLQARITRVKSLRVNDDTAPETAIAQFNVSLILESPLGKLRIPRFVKVYFVDSGGRWLVSDYEHFPATAGFKAESP